MRNKESVLVKARADVAKGVSAASGEDFITTRGAAEILGVTVRTVQNWVDSGKIGARLTLGGHRRLLRRDVVALATVPEPQKSELRPGSQDSSGPLRVLVVEDNPQLLELYRIRFSLFGVPHELHLAEDGIQGMLMVGRYKPQLLLMDLHMPGVDGFQMMHTLQRISEGQDIKVVVVTGLSAADVADRGGLPPGVVLLPKPVPFETLEMICMQRLTEIGLRKTA